VLFILIIGLALYASTTGAFLQAAKFLFYPDFSKLTGEGIVAAAGQAFFSIGIGLGAIMTFGAYLPKNVSIMRVAAGVAAADTAIALLAGLAIFPITFALGIDPASGPGLIFVSMPAAFASMPAGYLVGSLFFILLFVAAFSTGIGTIEPVVAWLERKGLNRAMAAAAAGAGAWAVGIAAALSFNVLADVRPLGFVPAMADKSIFDTLDFTIATVLLPVNGLLAALFAGWAMTRQATAEELGGSASVFLLWRVFVRFLAPVGILAILLSG
jgi:NSS family neurotransmitter:Na+ symporter